MKKSKFFKAPIPGENLTVNNRNYPWHRPPQHVEFDDAFESIVDEVFLDDDVLSTGMTMVSSGMSALAATQLLLIRRVGDGKITPDMSILLAGPVYKVFTQLLDVAKVPYLTGFDTEAEIRAYVEKMGGEEAFEPAVAPELTEEQKEEMESITEEALRNLPTGGLMGVPPTDVDEIEINIDELTGQSLVQPAEEDMEEDA